MDENRKMIDLVSRRRDRRRRRRIRIPALALVGVLALAWAPCFACEELAHTDGAPGFAVPAHCHGAGDSEASSCSPAIRAAGLVLPAPVVPPALASVLPALLSELRIPRPVAGRSQPVPLAPLVPLHRPPLYLLHESLLA